MHDKKLNESMPDIIISCGNSKTYDKFVFMKALRQVIFWSQMHKRDANYAGVEYERRAIKFAICLYYKQLHEAGVRQASCDWNTSSALLANKINT